MKKAILLLLPFRHVFRRLNLENRWWHRLSRVLFFTALLFAFLATAGLSYLTFAPQVSAMPNIGTSSDWVDDPQGTAEIPPPPDGSAIVEPEQSKTVPIPSGAQIDGNDPQWVNGPASDDKSIQMPDGTTATFPGSMSNDAIKSNWTRAKHRQIASALGFAALIAIGSTLLLSYVLQVGYRALLYVIFGGKPVTSPGSATP